MVNLSSKSRRRLIADGLKTDMMMVTGVDGLKTDMMMVTGVELWLAQKKHNRLMGIRWNISGKS